MLFKIPFVYFPSSHSHCVNRERNVTPTSKRKRKCANPYNVICVSFIFILARLQHVCSMSRCLSPAVVHALGNVWRSDDVQEFIVFCHKSLLLLCQGNHTHCEKCAYAVRCMYSPNYALTHKNICKHFRQILQLTNIHPGSCTRILLPHIC